MRKLVIACLTLAMMAGCAKEKLVTEPCGFDVKVNWVKGSRVGVTITPDNNLAYYSYGVMAEEDYVRFTESEVIDIQLEWMTSGYSAEGTGKKPSCTFADMYFYQGERTIRITGLATGQDYRLLVFQLNPETNKVGYIYKSYTTKLSKQVATTEAIGGTQKLGKLNVNGEFELVCKIPTDYKLQVVSLKGESIIASVTSDDITKPQMYLSIAYDELYGDVERMNDLSDEDLAILEESYSSEYEVEIEYRQTGYGTKLMVVKEIGGEENFVDFLSIYKGYLVEFNLTPNPKMANQTLTDEQIQMCIDFLTNVDFNPVQ